MAERMNFTKASLDAIRPPKSGTKIIYDAKQQNLCIWAAPSGRITFYHYGWSSAHNKPARVKLGVYRAKAGAVTGMTIALARQAAREAAGEYAKGVDIAQERAAERSSAKVGETIEALFEAYLDAPTRTGAKKKPSTIKTYRERYKLYIKPWARRKAATITTEDVRQLHKRVGNLKHAKAKASGKFTANGVLAILKSMFNIAIEQGMIATNPAAGVKRNDQPRNERHLKGDEAEKFLAALHDQYEQARHSPQCGGGENSHTIAVLDAISFALFTGQRKSNVTGLRWSQIDFSNKLMAVDAVDFKGNVQHVANIPPAAMDILERRKDNGSEYVFPSSRSRTGHIVEPTDAMNRIIKAAGIAHVRFHDLRHTFASAAVNSQIDLYALAKQLGHKSITQTQRYAHMDVSRHADAFAQAMDNFQSAGQDEKKSKKN